MIAALNNSPVYDPGYGSISSNFGSSNVDNIPSSGGVAGYTSARGAPVPVPTVVPSVVASLQNFGASGSYDTGAPVNSGATSTVNPTQSGDIGTALFDRLASLYGSKFALPSQASTSGTGVVVVPEAATATTSPAPASGSFVKLALLGAVAYVGYRAWKAHSG